MTKPLGCLSRSGIGSAVLTLVLLAAAGLVWGGRLYSPGPLSTRGGGQILGEVHSHAESKGRCSACHAPFWSAQAMSDRCLACHAEIAAELHQSDGLHAALSTPGTDLVCHDCHTEHQGSEAPLTRFDPKTFPHQATGYSLQGHAATGEGLPLACADCHEDDLTEFGPDRCIGCHRELDSAYMQAHEGDFGGGCLDCHDGLDTYGQAFDHTQTAFSLVGRHATLACSGCHPAARSSAELQSTSQDCFTCHQADDAHDGQLGADCDACHTPADWQQAIFDHAQTALPLEGRHADVACQDCHTDRVYQGTPQECSACHRSDDAHDGQLGQDCAACHDPAGWQQAVFDHAQTAFRLEGRHVEVTCQGCHTDGVYQRTPQECYACHQADDAHQGQLGYDCAACHNPGDWKLATFDHARSSFPLIGRHVEAACQDCHADGVYQGTPENCAACHQRDDAHDGQLGGDCGVCHTPADWQQVVFDHDRAVFPLTGAHLQVDCQDCHQAGLYRGTPQTCAGCHQDPAFHQGLLGNECLSCHSTVAWVPAHYDRAHPFPQSHGEGAPSPCRTCHPASLSGYTCYGCHEHEPAKVEEEHRDEGIPSFQDCTGCHPAGLEEGEED